MSDRAEALENRRVKVDSPVSPDKMNLKAAEVREGLSQITEMTVEFMHTDPNFRMKDLVGQPISVSIMDDDDVWHTKRGYCVAVQYLGIFQGLAHYSADVRSWLWFLTRQKDNRIFQEKSVIDIIKDVLGGKGFSSYLDDQTRGTYAKRTYCVQYDESDFAFLSRLMEEEGIYYFFDHTAEPEKLVLADDISAHKTVPGFSNIPYKFEGAEAQQREDCVYRWLWSEAVHTGKVTLDDFDFTKSGTDLKTKNDKPQGAHSHKNYEVYEYPGKHMTTAVGDKRAKVKMEAMAAQHEIWSGACNVRPMAVGSTFALKEHPRADQNADYLVTSAVFQFQIEPEEMDAVDPAVAELSVADRVRHFERRRHLVQHEESGTYVQTMSKLDFTKEHTDVFRCEFRAIPKNTPFRAPLATPWPEITGLQTAIVVGKPGDEIHTDEWGRIKVHFHWDRLNGKTDETSSCWIRTMNPWTGKDWGMISIPRVGQEVVIQFENGDPDRPMVVGALYNNVTKPPYALPDNKTMTGIKTNKSKNGGGFNEFVMEDKANNEYVRLQSERDYKEIIKNNAEIEIGLEHKSDGNLKQTIQNDKVETIKMGNDKLTVETGDQKIEIEKGNHSLKVKMGKSLTNAAQEVKLVCGGSSITLTPTAINIKSTMVTVEAQGVNTVKGAMVKVQGSGMIQEQAPLIKLN